MACATVEFSTGDSRLTLESNEKRSSATQILIMVWEGLCHGRHASEAYSEPASQRESG